MARTDEYGRFVPNDICEPLFKITGEEYKSDRFTSHLKQFCTAERGEVLRKTGGEYRWRYQFKNPLLQPYVLMQGINSGAITEQNLDLGVAADDDLPLFKHKP